MDERELRIGNLVLYEGKVIEVENIYNGAINVWFSEGGWGDAGYLGNDIKVKDCVPLVLSAEILERFGFQKTEAWPWVYYLNKIAIDMDMETAPKYFGSPSTAPVKYVHQLQNLYYSLTGQELTLNNRE